MRKRLPYLIALFVLLSGLFTPITSVIASNETIFQHHQTTIPSSQSVEHVVIIGGDTTIQGTVRETIIVINGDLHISKSAHIPGVIFVLGGHITQEPGAQVTDDVINFSLDNETRNSIVMGGIFLMGNWFLGLVLSLLVLLFTVVMASALKHRLDPFISMLHQHPIRLLLIGIAAHMFLVAIGILLSVTLIGIPVLVALVLSLGCLFLIGVTAMSHYIVEYLPNMLGKPLWVKSLLGATVLVSFIHFPLFGGVIFLALFWISLGMVIWWLWEKQKDRSET